MRNSFMLEKHSLTLSRLKPPAKSLEAIGSKFKMQILDFDSPRFRPTTNCMTALESALSIYTYLLHGLLNRWPIDLV